MVLIILATVSINLVFSENGIINQAQKAADFQANAEASDQGAMNTYDQYIANAIPQSGEGEPEANIDPETGWNLDKVTKVTSEDNVVVPVPIGYTASTVEGEKSVSTGFVIKEGTDGALTTGINEFVWVPVSDPSTMYGTDANGNKLGKLYSFSGTSSSALNWTEADGIMSWTSATSYREPDVVTVASSGNDSTSGTEYDAVSTNLQQAGLSATATATDFKIQLQNEFNEMIESVKIYGGFYIGRYETGNLSQSTAVVQKGNTDIGGQTWYTQYKVNKTIKANDNVVSSMIWGCQWDATMRWMQSSSNSEVANFPISSASYGNYYDNSITYVENGETKTTTAKTSTRIPTGSAETTKINNIYDMAGNIYDWSLEANYDYHRTCRGGNYFFYGSSRPASNRSSYTPANIDSSYGCRSTLYVAL